ncbi:MAG: hypothetical protein FWF03_05525 [Defluviitaleaceae bacterium]|nr:hypothetical protein [Defluviitaleaceae bacterium]
MADATPKGGAVAKMRSFYSMEKDAPLVQKEFGFFAMDRWKREGHIKDGDDLNALFGFDGPSTASLGGLGWCEAAFIPRFDEEVIEDRGEHELVRDFAGRHVLFFKGRRNGFMPEYVAHPVSCRADWERDVKWRLDPDAPGRLDDAQKNAEWAAKTAETEGFRVCQAAIGGYMYLRSLVGPEGILYMVYDDPGLVHEMMEAWFNLADAVIERHQRHATLDEFFLAEDICYNHGPLISPDMMREFLFPYYNQIITNIKKRQLDKTRRLFIQIDTDGDCRPVIPVYQEIGMDYMSPFEVASGCDVVELGKQYPRLLMRGGIDKRILASGKDAIDRMIEKIIPTMKRRGGYIPVCDHGVPEEVNFEDYMHYRKRMAEF